MHTWPLSEGLLVSPLSLTISGYTTNHQIKRVSVGFDKNRMNGWAKSRYVPQGYLSIQAVKCIHSIYK